LYLVFAYFKVAIRLLLGSDKVNLAS
jgi:hypothetical protein